MNNNMNVSDTNKNKFFKKFIKEREGNVPVGKVMG